MNLLDKKLLGVILILTLTIFSCEEENELGSNINPAEDKLKVEFQEFTLPAKNVFFDSVRTDLDPYILTGTINDDLYGNISAEGYQSINILTGALPDIEAELDSVKINLRFLDYFTDPSAKSHTIEVRQLLDTLYEGVVYQAKRQGNFVSGLEGTPIPIGRHTYEIDAARDSVLSFRLSDFYGNLLLDKLSIIRGTTIDAVFRSFAPGEVNPIALVTDNGNDALVAFNATSESSNITLHYHTPDEDSLSYSFVFRNVSGDPLPSYNHVDVNRAGSDFSILTEEKLQVVDIDENLVHMHPLSGIYPFVDLTEMYDFFDAELAGGDPISIISSQIVMPIDPSDTTEFESSSSSLQFVFSDDQGRFDGGQVVLNPARNAVLADDSYLGIGNAPALALGSLNNDLFAITSDISIFSQLMIENRIDPDEEGEAFPSNLVMMPPLSSSINQTSFFKDGIKIRVYYTVLK